MPPCRYRWRSLIWVSLIVLFAVRKGFVGVSFVVWLTEERCLLYKIYQRVDYPIYGYLNHFVATRNGRVSAALDNFALVIPRCRTDRRLCLLLFVCGTFCRWPCLVVSP